MKTRKVGIIGLGHVGAHVAYSLAVQGIADELVLVDSNEKKVESECQDLRDSVAYLPHRVTVNIGTYEDLGDCDVIVNSIGKIEILRANQDRTDEMKFTVPAVNSYVGRVKASGFDGVVVNITNPCDVVTQQLAKGLGLPRGRVFGTGTGLDTSRLLSALARQTTSQDFFSSSFSLSFRESSTTSSTPFLPITQGTPTNTSFSPYSPQSSALAGIICFSSCSTMLTMRAAVVAMPYSVQYFPENVTQPPRMDSFCRASLSKRKRSSVFAHSSKDFPRKETLLHAANC